jgi:hypothetical protein
MLIRRKALALILFTALSQAPHAAAQDVPPVVTALLKSWENSYKMKPTYKSVSADGGTIVINDLEAKLAPEGTPGGMTVTINKMELGAVAQGDGGIFDIGSAKSTDMKFDISGADGTNFSISIPAMTTEHWYVKALGDNPTPADKLRASMNVARKTTTGPITLTAMGQTVTADGYGATWDGDPTTGAGKVEGKISNVAIPEGVLAMADPSGTLKNLGYTSLSFDVGGGGTISNDGNQLGMDLDAYYAGKDMGTFKFGFAVAGISMALIEELQKMEKEPDPSKLLPLAQSMNFGRLIVRFEDAGITGKLIPLAAKMQGSDPKTMIANAGAMVQIGMSQLNAPALTDQVVKAVSAYLADPKSITVSMKPTAPLGLTQLMALSPADPAAAVTMLGVSVTAND